MNINEIYVTDSKFLRAENLQPNTRVPVKIVSYSVAKFEDGKRQICLAFEGKDKVLGLNKTNATTLAGLIGSENVDDWIGHKVKLYRTRTDYQGKQVDCIRIDDSFCENPDGQSTIRHAEESSDVPF